MLSALEKIQRIISNHPLMYNYDNIDDGTLTLSCLIFD